MGVAILPVPAQLYDIYQGGPLLGNAGRPLFFSDYTTYGLWDQHHLSQLSTAPRPVWIFSQGGAGITQVGERYKGVFAMKAHTTVAAMVHSMGGLSFEPITDVTGLAGGYITPSFRRVNWLRVNLAQEAASALGDQSGLLMFENGGAQAGTVWPVAPSAKWESGFGIVGDGSGGWDWTIWGTTGVGNAATERVNLMADGSDWHTFDFVTISGAGGREASFQLYVDGDLTLTRLWVAGGVGALMPSLEATSYRWTPSWQVGTTTDDPMYFGPWEWKQGRFTPDGRELLK